MPESAVSGAGGIDISAATSASELDRSGARENEETPSPGHTSGLRRGHDSWISPDGHGGISIGRRLETPPSDGKKVNQAALEASTAEP